MTSTPSDCLISISDGVAYTGSVLISSSVATSCVLAAKKTKSTTEISSRATSNLHGPVGDVAAMYEFFRTQSVTVDRMFNDVTDPLRNAVMESISALLNSGRQRCFLYYSGHGKIHSGDWCFHEEFITLADILTVWRERMCRSDYQMLILIADCCYSGAWVEALHREKVEGVWMQASAAAHELATDTPKGGAFTLRWISRMKFFHAPALHSPWRVFRPMWQLVAVEFGWVILLESHPRCYDPCIAAFERKPLPPIIRKGNSKYKTEVHSRSLVAFRETFKWAPQWEVRLSTLPILFIPFVTPLCLIQWPFLSASEDSTVQAEVLLRGCNALFNFLFYLAGAWLVRGMFWVAECFPCIRSTLCITSGKVILFMLPLWIVLFAASGYAGASWCWFPLLLLYGGIWEFLSLICPIGLPPHVTNVAHPIVLVRDWNHHFIDTTEVFGRRMICC
jgi:hypothetical protein